MQKKITKKKKPRNIKKPMHWFKKIILFFILITSVVLAAYLVYLDHTVRKTFKEKPWSIPAKVYASPLEIYGGYQTTARQFEDFLTQLNYKQDYELSSEGSYYRKGQQISLKTRRFTFWDTGQESQLLRVKFSGSAIKTILSLSTSQEIPIIRMDPVQIGSFYPTRKEDRILITLDKTPKALVHALLATEDHNFYSHIGISFKAIARAAWINIRAGSVVQGGSTITQQLIKNFYLSPKKSLWRKLNEAMMAIVLEFNYEKDEILQAYLNEIYLGQNGASSVHGFGLASQFYFGRPLENLPLHDIAALVALVRGPSYYDLRRHPTRAVKRRNLVLDEMHKRGYLTKEEALAARQKKLNVVPRHHGSTNRYPSFLDLVRRRLRKEYKKY
jgi:penicillin-binding protein 1B